MNILGVKEWSEGKGSDNSLCKINRHYRDKHTQVSIARECKIAFSRE